MLLVALRFLQGLGLGGEWGGAVLMTLESGDPNRRGLNASWPQVGVPIGLLLANGVLSLMGRITDDAEFLSWGWRVPFLLSGILVIVGLWIRRSLSESPMFEEATHGEPEAAPVLQVLQRYPRQVLLAIGSRIAAAVQGCAIPLFGHLSDKIGRRPIYLAGAIGAIIWVAIFFPLLDTGKFGFIVLAAVVALVVHAAMYGPQASFISEMFPTRVRYTGASMGYQLAGILGGALAPIISTWLLKKYDSAWPIVIYVGAMLLLTTVCVLAAPETAHADIDEEPRDAVAPVAGG